MLFKEEFVSGLKTFQQVDAIVGQWKRGNVTPHLILNRKNERDCIDKMRLFRKDISEVFVEIGNIIH